MHPTHWFLTATDEVNFCCVCVCVWGGVVARLHDVFFLCDVPFGKSTLWLTEFFFPYATSVKMSGSILSHPLSLQTKLNGYLGWNLAHGAEYSVSNDIFYGQCSLFFVVSQARCPVPSCPLYRQDWMDIWAKILHKGLNTVSSMQFAMANVIYIKNGISGKMSCPILSHPVTPWIGLNGHLGWNPANRLNTVFLVQSPMANVWHLREDFLSFPVLPPTLWTRLHPFSASNQDSVMMFGSYERSLKALLKFLWCGWYGNISLVTLSVKWSKLDHLAVKTHAVSQLRCVLHRCKDTGDGVFIHLQVPCIHATTVPLNCTCLCFSAGCKFSKSKTLNKIEFYSLQICISQQISQLGGPSRPKIFKVQNRRGGPSRQKIL